MNDKQSTMSHAAAWHPHDQSSARHTRSTRLVSELRSFIYELVESRIHVVRELDLSHGLHSLSSTSYRETHNTLLSQGRIEDSRRPKVRSQICGASKDTSEGYVLAKDYDRVVYREGVTEGGIDGFVEGLADGF